MQTTVPAGVFDPDRLAAVRATGLLDTGPEEPFDRLAALAATLLDAPLAFITVVDDRRSYWKSCIGVAGSVPEERQIAVEESFCQYVVGSQGPLIVGDTAADPRTRDKPAVTSRGVASWAGFPLFAPGGEVLGALCVADTSPRDWSARDIEVLRTLSLVAAGEVAQRAALEAQQRAGEAAVQALERARMLLGASTEAAFSMQAEAVLEALAGAAVPGLADWCTVHTAAPGGAPTLAAVVHADAPKADLIRAVDRDPLSTSLGPAAVIRSGEPELHRAIPSRAAHTTHLGADHARRLDEVWPCSALILPLLSRGRVLGAITLAFSESARTYTEEFVDLAGMFAAQGATALDNARLYAEQAEVAHTLQASLLPEKLPDLPGVELAAAYRAAGRANDVGGDFYDIFPTDGEAWAFIIGDVVGKGARAAALTLLVRHAAEAASLRGESPAADMALVNELFGRRAGAGEFCSAIYGWLRPIAGGVQISLVSAGHPPPLLLHLDGELEEIAAHGPVLGLDTAAAFPQIELALRTGEILVVYTDGATELRGNDPGRAEAALHQAIRESAGSSADELVERVEHQTLLLSNGEPRDDFALLALRAT